MTFASLGLPNAILKGIRAAGLTEPTAIQSKAIPTILQGNDLIGQAQSGSGKTGAYLIPILARLLEASTRLRALILVPTKELAQYVETRARDYARFTDIKIGVVFTGAPLAQNERLLREQPVDVLVATTGRLLELAERKAVNFEHIEVLVLEEADKMVAAGLGPEVRRLLKLLPETRQTLMFTMTLPPELNRLAKEALIEPVRVDLAPGSRTAPTTVQLVYPVPRDLKYDLLHEILAHKATRNTVLFTHSRFNAERLARMLQRRGHVVAVLDEQPILSAREQALEDLRRGRVQILVASDAAGRTLDLAGVAHVVNFDVPQTPEDYAHRLGRPGRPDGPGQVFSLMSPEEQKDVGSIERLLGRVLDRTFQPDFDYGMRPSEIKQALSWEDESPRPKRPASGVQSAAAKIAAVPRPAAGPAPKGGAGAAPATQPAERTGTAGSRATATGTASATASPARPVRKNARPRTTTTARRNGARPATRKR
ncbi:MAG TPA: DEAD/DEAH box helicase [Candidatus Eisenbacteria bacterium]|nr:DEAD/DEAH box helicase [Candidatus Eisenbacteria bacterium]